MYIYFTIEETETTEAKHVPKVTQLVNSDAKIWNQVCLTSNLVL